MKRLEFIFENQVGKNVTYSMDSPTEPADPVVVSATMDTIIAENVFSTSGGDVVKKKGARIVDRQVTDIELDIDIED